MIFDIVSIATSILTLILTILAIVFLLKGSFRSKGKTNMYEVLKGFIPEEGGTKPHPKGKEIAKDLAEGRLPSDLLYDYYTLGLDQARITFWLSMVFAVIGFLIIVTSIFMPEATHTSHFLLSSKALSLFSGVIIDAIAALFFTQSNSAKKLLLDFSEKLRIDAKLREGLTRAGMIEDKKLQSIVNATLSLNLSQVHGCDQLGLKLLDLSIQKSRST